ncbi:ferritin-like domain-containing protein [Actinomadura barringtoniae]|uniref:ferritin-like domain-containing protein n=1 Tax=Actinomadura barringtoniae TaxID=1427535 RepID=UPI001FB7866B|nr:ferritin-like domain-containing protein [Actinomadura barringtoniae]
MPHGRRAVSRRAVLGGAAALTLPLLTGCAHHDEALAAPGPEVAILNGAMAAQQDLIAQYEAALGTHASLAKYVNPALAHHREQLALLRRYYVPGSGKGASAGPSLPSPQTHLVSRQPSRALASLRSAEGKAAVQCTTDAGKAGPGLAQLLASIGASEAAFAGTSGVPKQTLQPAKPSPLSTATLNSLQSALATEHAAIYGYGVLGARLTGSAQELATVYWDGHRARRDSLTTFLTEARQHPVAAAAAYKLPVKVTSSRSAAELAAKLEDDLVSSYVGLAAATDPRLREMGAYSAQEAMGRAVRWRAGAGLATAPASAFPGLPPAALAPKPTPGD